MVIENFTPVSALIGGGFIGLAAVLLLALNGRIAGISGIAGGLLRPAPGDAGWRIAFIVGLVIGAGLYGLPAGIPIVIDATLPMLLIGGLLVGFGTRLGGGCTSGHGVCGIARLSKRSIVATLTFMAAAVVTVFVMRHVVGG
jgi:uncharacterized protein